MKLATLALYIVGYKDTDNNYWWFIRDDQPADQPILPSPFWPNKHAWDTYVHSTQYDNKLIVGRKQVQEAVETFSKPPPQSEKGVDSKGPRKSSLDVMATVLAEAVRFQCIEEQVLLRWIKGATKNGARTDEPMTATTPAVENGIKTDFDRALSKVTIATVRTSWAAVIKDAEEREKKLVYVGLTNEQVARKLVSNGPWEQASPAPDTQSFTKQPSVAGVGMLLPPQSASASAPAAPIANPWPAADHRLVPLPLPLVPVVG